MSSHILVCPFSEELLSRIRGKKLAVRLNSIDEISFVSREVPRSGNHLHCAIYQTQASLSEIPFQEEWQHVPLVLTAADLGGFLAFAGHLPIVRQLNLMIRLPIECEENYTSLRILSSLGIAATVLFGKTAPLWDALTDLMVYAILNRAPHAPLEPFFYIASHYEPEGPIDFNDVYFENPSKYLHLNKDGLAALSGTELDAGKFISKDLDQLDAISECEDYTERLEEMRRSSLRTDGCSSCPGWKVCLGKFCGFMDENTGCRQFFAELIDVAQRYQAVCARGNERRQRWGMN
jgi:hypothetical protein